MAAKFGIANGRELAVPRGPIGCSMWRGIMQVLYLFHEGLSLKVGDGSWVKFWRDAWCGGRALRLDFPDLFDLAIDPLSLVAANYSVNGGDIVWNPIFRKNLHDWEIPRVLELLIKLQAKHRSWGTR